MGKLEFNSTFKKMMPAIIKYQTIIEYIYREGYKGLVFAVRSIGPLSVSLELLMHIIQGDRFIGSVKQTAIPHEMQSVNKADGRSG